MVDKLTALFTAELQNILARMPGKNTLEKHRHPIRYVGVPGLAELDQSFNEALDQATAIIQEAINQIKGGK